ncbi:hypothetical protein FHW67_002934 [Herbaspirillum sp. Sphag1AN]|uniref:hypothetical protein n=1 Tax=unclassified Herbaspirillum TaxID=2624150 RepID=UPI00161F278C|nr:MULTISPECIES: hypothetical protein [unclassified Herbaspirillum]MBB3213636.1 hypothetical protein [Herbaspirillum sp. Sphag1AN]MBB3246834.1 hypothetical protein [Herbaspirillum sp. Sphag64]
MHNNDTNPLWAHNAGLIDAAILLIGRLQREAHPGFNYAQAVGPHLRHIIEHYTALLAALDSPSGLVDYDARERDLALQSVPQVTLAKLTTLRTRFETLMHSHGPAASLATSLTTRLQTGPAGELSIMSNTSLGRELCFLSSHTVHHFAVLVHLCHAAGVELGHDFDKAPATLAHERQAA